MDPIQPKNGKTTTPADFEGLVALQQAILAAEHDNFGPLKQWYRQRDDPSLIDTGAKNTNHGTPLYIATVLDSPKAVETLLSIGADPNWNHPIHGDTCLLHASERGYVECLRHLLNSRDIKGTMHKTVDRKIFLGQGMPQYQEGGRNPLHVAALNGRVDAVKLLLEFDKQRQQSQWLQQKDSFGRGMVQVVADAVAMKQETSPIRSSLDFILHLIAAPLGMKDGREWSIPSASEAIAAERERQRSLRARCLQSQLRKQQIDRIRGLQTIERSYSPLHLDVYCSSVPRDAVIEESLLDSGAQIQEPLPGVFTIPLLGPEFCSRVWDELHHYEEAALAHPENRLPLHERHDGNLGNLQDCGFANFLGALQSLLQPLVDQCLHNAGPFEIYHAFLTRNWPELEKNATFKLHRDKSDWTFNVCLHKSEDVIGSTVGFYAANLPDENSGDSDELHEMEQLSRAFTYEHKVGAVVFHSGSHFHKTDPIQRGTRGSLIMWARRLSTHKESNHRRPKVGDVVCLGGNSRVKEGVLAKGGVGVVLDDDQVSKQPFRVGLIQQERAGREHSYYHIDDLIVLEDEPSTYDH